MAFDPRQVNREHVLVRGDPSSIPRFTVLHVPSPDGQSLPMRLWFHIWHRGKLLHEDHYRFARRAARDQVTTLTFTDAQPVANPLIRMDNMADWMEKLLKPKGMDAILLKVRAEALTEDGKRIVTATPWAQLILKVD